jgi:hypothetical protein
LSFEGLRYKPNPIIHRGLFVKKLNHHGLKPVSQLLFRRAQFKANSMEKITDKKGASDEGKEFAG